MTGSVAAACCVEYGALEETTLRMIESLRRWGGRFADIDVVAVTPRRGPALARGTLDGLRDLGAEHVALTPRHRYLWHVYLNKYFALREVERRTDADYIAWFDSDLLFVDEPGELVPSADFAACARDKNIGTSGPNDPNEPYWSDVCSVLALDLDRLPRVRTEVEQEDIRLYWNAGLFIYRRGSGLLDQWFDSMIAVLDRRTPSIVERSYWVDQVVLGLATVQRDMSFRPLPITYNYPHASFIDYENREQLANARIVHYHDSMKPEVWGRFVSTLGEPHTEVARWLRAKGPVEPRGTLQQRTTHQVLRAHRSARRRIWESGH